MKDCIAVVDYETAKQNSQSIFYAKTWQKFSMKPTLFLYC